ncbi:MAG: ribonuclease III [Anaerohalosphaeraceae bacterium]
MQSDDLSQVEAAIGYHFQRQELLHEALTHSSQADDRLDSNERMEFLGDSVLSLVVCQFLYERFPSYLEGEMTRLKSTVVSRKSCSEVAAKLNLIDFIRVGKGTDNSRAIAGSIASGMLEAVIAAIYLDGGLEAANRFILSAFEPVIMQADANEHQDNFKSMLQQYCQKNFNTTPMYELLDEKGPDHNKCFEIAAVINHRRYPGAWSITKKDAEQRAARNALVKLGLLEPLPEEE